MVGLFLMLFVGLELKHLVADYFLQPGCMLAGKGNFAMPGGYAHAGVHVALSAVVLLLAGVSLPTMALLVAAEFVVHYLLDYSKISYSRGVHVDTNPRRFWALHGIDQFGHQLTYAVIILVAMASMGLA